jgi:DNA-binding MarR family transcriptional regulator
LKVAEQKLPEEARKHPDDAEELADFGRMTGHVGYQLRRAFLGSNRYFRDLLGPAGIAPGQYSIFSLICHNEGINQKTLAAIRKVDRSTIVPTLDHLEACGWIRRVRQAPDRRVTSLVPTAAGRRKLASLDKLVDEHERALTSRLNAAEKGKLLELLGRIIDTPLRQ